MTMAILKKSIVFGISCLILAPSLSHAFGESSVIQNYVEGKAPGYLIKPDWANFTLNVDNLNKFYSLRGYQAVWVNSDGVPNGMAKALKQALLTAPRQGLIAADYWDENLELLYKASSVKPQNWITFELAATEAMIRYATHLSSGRFDPKQIDEDIKFEQKVFNGYTELIGAVSYGEASLAPSLENFAPNNYRYRDLIEVLAQLRAIKDSGSWETLVSPGFALRLGVKDPIISKLRQRLNSMGYRISKNGGDKFDDEFDDVLKRFQANNGLTPDGIIGTKSEVLRFLNQTVSSRIAQVEVTMEKLRWLPMNMETRHIFVNLATTEFRLFDESGMPFVFRTVNGQAFRRTPSMRDSITYVNLNPYWTVPRSIAIRDKLPTLREDPYYLDRNNMVLVDEYTNRIVNTRSIPWRSITPAQFTYYIRQAPGVTNALGVVKFPLQNPWAIYMHDTNDKKLFSEVERHRSSGCVRLERPMELAAYLLRDQPNWDIYSLLSYVPQYEGAYFSGELDKNVLLKKAMPVYFMYLTADRTSEGGMRFVEDGYGQDIRTLKAIQNKRVAGEIF